MQWILDKLAGLASPHHARPAIPATNEDRIAAIPYEVLPYASPARDALVSLALHGCDVDAYTPAASHEWVIWCRPAKDAPNQDGRYTVAEWQAAYAGEVARLLPPVWTQEGW